MSDPFVREKSLLSGDLIKVPLRNMSLRTIDDGVPDQLVFSALVDPTRRTIIELLADHGQMNATDVFSNFKMTEPAVSQHLKVLREANLVRMEKSAQKHLYSLNPKTMRDLEAWVKQTTQHWNERFEQLDALLEAEQRKTVRKRR